MVVWYDRRYINRLADIYVDILMSDGEGTAKDWLFRTCTKDFDLLERVDTVIPERAYIRGVSVS